MPNNRFISQFYLKIGGSNASEELMSNVLEIVVDTSLYVPDMFTLLIQDDDLKWVDDTLFNLGKEVEISVEPADELGGGSKTVLMKGEITALEPDFDAEGKTTLLVRGYNKSHRLHRGKQTRTFLKQKDDAVVRKIAGEVGLSPQIDSTTITYDYILQNNQTNMEFLQERAGRIGYQVYAAEGKLYFKKGDAKLGDGPTLKFTEELRTFRPVIAATHQADKITVKGWDAKGKKAITSSISPNSSLNQGGATKTGGVEAKVFGNAEFVITDQPVFSPDEAKALATGAANDISRDYLQAEGTCLGHPQVKAGYTVTIDGIGARFKGKYFVTSATHIYTKADYETHFTISGRQPNTLSHLLQSTNGQSKAQGLVQGVKSGLVTNIQDPDNLGRVKVKYGWLGDIESDWIRIATPMGGPERGFMYLPEVNDEVLLGFDNGNVHHPYIVGYLWNSKDKPPKPTNQVIGGGKVNERILKSRSGHIIILDDTDGAEKIIIRDKTETNEMIIDSKEKSMAINVDGDFTVKAKGKITMESTKDMVLSTKANGTLKTTGDMKLEVTKNLTTEAKLNATLKGLKLSLEGKTQAELKGLTVSVNGSTLTEVKGALVKIN